MQVHESQKDYLKMRKRLVNEVYRDDPCYRDSTNPLLTLVMNPFGSFADNAEIIPMMVEESGAPLVCALFIIADKMPDVLQVGFFEALSDCFEAVEMLIANARSIAESRGINRIVIGLDGHLNNGVGFLAESNGKTATFGSCYNPPYYIDYMERCSASSNRLVSYLHDLSIVNLDKERRVINRVSRRFKVRKGDFSDLRREIGVYTRLNNECFKEHPLYFERSVDEDYELFKSFGPFLKEENFLVSELDGSPIGFLLWYPDFHELIKPGRSLGLVSLLKYRLPGNSISRFKIAEFGVLPEFQGTAAIAGLINEAIEAGKIMDIDIVSPAGFLIAIKDQKDVVTRWAEKPYKSYKYFEIEVDRRVK